MFNYKSKGTLSKYYKKLTYAVTYILSILKVWLSAYLFCHDAKEGGGRGSRS